MREVYQIQATVTLIGPQTRMMRQIPTFYLDPEIQGIVDCGHAIRIAKTVVDPFNHFDVHVIAAKIKLYED